MRDEVILVGKRCGLVIKDCAEKVTHFCEHDAFPHYDRIGYKHSKEGDRFQSELLTAMNKAMMARSSRKAWAPLLDRPLAVLAEVPIDVDLIESSDEKYLVAREQVRKCYTVLTAEKWITDMAASKMLYLKRPRLIAISDSYVREALGIEDPNMREYPWRAPFFAERALSVGDVVRRIGIKNREVLNIIQEKVAPTEVSKARVLDILIWVDMAIAAGHPNWSYVAKLRNWESIGTNLKGLRTETD